MKKIIALFVMLFAFSVGMNAQDRSKIEEAARKDVGMLKEIIELDKQTEDALFWLFVKKHDAFAAPDLNEERVKGIAQTIEAKLRATLSDEKIETLIKKDKNLFRQLVANGK
ncbi:hypothetical protein [Flavobacterium suncheonense]|uniref:Uncharacterized protein n=1 Tax=Flavobacterium suncheonense GH29-5 = DSM 17707 TaxID=1121899 RepID=A0A0A2MKL5_9FLAO|nr:hypothetical protein [Flavobacterium suncheonense]KGO88860.1 hypothetical protein Q764_10605 [Flavobacterium suncheonense GH29-5 = DSM 17707]